MNFTFLNKTMVTLAGTLAAGATTTTLHASSSGLLNSASVSSPIRMIVWDATTYAHPAADPNAEILDVTGASGTSVSAMVRGRENTSDVNHTTGAVVYKMAAIVTAAMLQEIQLRLNDVYAGDPEGAVDGYPGRQIYNTVAGVTKLKTSPVGTLTGWI